MNHSCQRCPDLVASRHRVVSPVPPESVDILCIGEAPGQTEDKLGYPFAGQAGQLIRPVLATAIGTICMRYHLPLFTTWYTNMVRCWPGKGNRNPTAAEVENCSPYLVYEILKLKPKLILCLGKVPAEGVQRVLAEIDYQGIVRSVYHPAYILRSPGKREAWEAEIRGVIEELAKVSHEQPPLPEKWGILSPFRIGNPVLGVDTEYDTADKGDVAGQDTLVSVQVSDGHVGYLWAADQLPVVQDRLRRHRGTVAFAHIRADIPKMGMDFGEVDWEDVLLAAYVLRLPHALKQLGPHLTGMAMREFREVVPKGKKFSEVLAEDPESATTYAILDAVVTARCWRVLDSMLGSDPPRDRYYREFEKPLVPILHQMESTGVLLDPDVLTELDGWATEAIDEADQVSKQFGDIDNLGSNNQVATWLMHRGWEPTKFTDAGKPQVNEAVLLEVQRVAESEEVQAFCQAVLNRRELIKFRSTYTRKLLEVRDPHGRVHTQYHQTVTDTNRLSSSRPNLQNIPAKHTDEDIGHRLRRAFIARPGYVWVHADYSQLQVRIFADYTQEPVLLEAYRTGQDVHQAAADMLGIDRKSAKNSLFAVMFGVAEDKLAATAGVQLSEAGDFLTKIKTRMPAFLNWPKQVEQFLEMHGYVETKYGWMNYYPLYFSPIYRERAAALREAANLPIQGTEVGIVKRFMQRMQPVFDRYDSIPVLTVHDEVNAEVPYGAVAEVGRAMQRIGAECGLPEVQVPLVVEVTAGPNWSDQVPLDDWLEVNR